MLCLKIMEYCRLSESVNGGIISIKEMVRHINSIGSSYSVTTADIESAINRLSVLGNELTLVKIGHRIYIKSTRQELSQDQTIVLDTADVLGYVSVKLLMDNFQWKRIRAVERLEDLVGKGVLWVDDDGEERKFWITSYIYK